MFEDRTLICDGDENEFIDIIRKKKGSVAIQMEKVEVERHLLANSQVALDKNCGDEEFKVIGNTAENGNQKPKKDFNSLFASMGATPGA